MSYSGLVLYIFILDFSDMYGLTIILYDTGKMIIISTYYHEVSYPKYLYLSGLVIGPIQVSPYDRHIFGPPL